MAGQELVKVEEYAALQESAADLVETVHANLGDEQLTQFDLDRVRMPSGGSLVFEVPTLEGGEAAKRIDGVIVFFKNTRAYWETGLDESGGGTPPDCRSDDGKLGIGHPGDELAAQGKGCADCPNSRWGSGRDGRGQACSQRRLLFVLRPEGLLPLVVDLAPTSLAPAKKYMTRLASNGVPYYDVVTSIGLERTSGQGVPDYARATFQMAARLEGETRERVRAYAAAMKPLFTQVKAMEEVE